jgi:uncharacterized protein
MESIVGGVIIGVAVSVMLLFNGRVTGISGIIGGVLNPQNLDKNWRIMFLVGLLAGGLLLKFIYPASLQLISHAHLIDYGIAGFLVGFGTLLGNGCTSGHGVCGISRFSMRSILATVTFIAFGVLGVILFKLVRGEL